jgi:hypothetical protein
MRASATVLWDREYDRAGRNSKVFGAAREGSIQPERKFPRLFKRLTFQLADGLRADVIDMSAIGLRIRCFAPPRPQSILDGVLVMEDGRTIALRGEVIWVDPPEPHGWVPADVGLLLTEVPDDYRRAIVDLFAREA